MYTELTTTVVSCVHSSVIVFVDSTYKTGKMRRYQRWSATEGIKGRWAGRSNDFVKFWPVTSPYTYCKNLSTLLIQLAGMQTCYVCIAAKMFWSKEHVMTEVIESGQNWQSDRRDFWAWSVEILVFASPTGYLLTSFGFSILSWSIFP